MKYSTAHRIPVIVLGSGITLLGTLRCLGYQGIPSLCPTRPSMDEQYSRWFRPLKVPDLAYPISEKDDLALFLERCGLDRAVLMPCSDYWTQLVAQLPEKFRTKFPSCQSTSELHAAFTDKGKFRDLLLKHKVPHPQTIFVEQESQSLLQIPEHELKNFFIKPRDSQGFSQHFGVKGYWATSSAVCSAHIERLHQAGFEVVLQEYIPGPATQHFYLEGLIDRAGHCKALFARQRIRMSPADFGNSTFMTSIPLQQVAPARDVILKFLSDVGYRGIFSAEFKFDQRDQTFKLLEINARPWWYVEFAALCGVNLPALAYADALESELPKIESYQSSRYCVNFLADFALWRDYISRGKFSSLSWVFDWLKAYPTVFSWRDIKPGIAWLATRSSRHMFSSIFPSRFT